MGSRVSFARDLKRLGMCAFCAHHSHDYPQDERHEQMHMEGWHTCEIDGRFRHHKWNCRNYAQSENVYISI